jgi:hypothetical protein
LLLLMTHLNDLNEHRKNNHEIVSGIPDIFE